MSNAIAKLAVEGLPRRVAHASHALLVASAEQRAPVYSAEVALRDPEATSIRVTVSALSHARRRGLAIAAGPPGTSVWIATPLCHELEGALEDRFLAETEEPTSGEGGDDDA